MPKRWLSLLCVIAAACSAVAVPPPPDEDELHFDLRVNGKPVEPFDDPEALAQYKPHLTLADQADLERIHWRVAEPITGDIALQVVYNVPGSGSFGQRAAPELLITPLEGQQLPEAHASGSAETPRTGDLSEASTSLEPLPPGAYLLRVTLWGSENWDRKYILVQVE